VSKIDDGKLVIDRSGKIRFEADKGRLQLHHTNPEPENPDGPELPLCSCPQCYNYYTVICVESGEQCIPLDPEIDGFCRKDSPPMRPDSLPDTFNMPQLYSPEEVKQYYPNWPAIEGWDQQTDLWLEFQGYWGEERVYEYDPVTGEWKEYFRDKWFGPPTGKEQKRINYEIDIATPDFDSEEDSTPAPLLMNDILDCPDYLFEYEPQQQNRCTGPGKVLWHPATNCTSNCRCTFTKGQYKQWMKNNNREEPYLYIPVLQPSYGNCTSGYVRQGDYCFGPAQPRPRGLYTQCQPRDSYSRCTDSEQEYDYVKEYLYQCCQVPPSLIGWSTCMQGSFVQTMNEYTFQLTGASMSVGQTNNLQGQEGPFAISLLFDNNTSITIPGISLTASIPDSAVLSTDYVPQWNDTTARSTSLNRISFCCNNYDWKLRLTAGGEMWWKPWPAGINSNGTPGTGYFGLPKTVTVHFWTNAPTSLPDDPQSPVIDEDGLLKVIEYTLPLAFAPVTSPGCHYNEAEDQCVPDVGARCDCDGGAGFTCGGRWSARCGNSGSMSSPHYRGPWNLRGYYGNRCFVSESQYPHDVNVRNTPKCSHALPGHRFPCTYGYGTSYALASVPGCYYKNCLYGLGIEDATTTPLTAQDALQWTATRAALIDGTADKEAAALVLPTLHGGFCTHSVPDESRTCNTCGSPYIRCTYPEGPGTGKFPPRLCGQGKCNFFEMREERTTDRRPLTADD